MSEALPPQDLLCPDPARCPVPPELPALTTCTLPAGTPAYRAYASRWGHDERNPGRGDSRFAPVDDPRTGRRLPSMYVAGTEVAALLETVFRDVHHASPRLVYKRDLRGTPLAHLRFPRDAVLVDLRDDALSAVGLDRSQVSATSAEHYPCTRRIAVHALADPAVHGLVWHSRQSELLGRPPVETLVLYGGRYRSGRGRWPLAGPGSRNLAEGPGRLLVDELALALDATVVPDS